MIWPGYVTAFIYHTETGDVSGHGHEPRRSGFPWVSFYSTSDCREYHHLRHHGTPQYGAPAEDGGLVSHIALGGEWRVTDPDGRHRFWVPVGWRVP